MCCLPEGKGKAEPTRAPGGLLLSGWDGSSPSAGPLLSDFPLGKEHSTGRFQFQPVQRVGRLEAENRTIKGSSGQENS